jgi:ATP-dependent Clp protease ATP-binding subunit ClpC
MFERFTETARRSVFFARYEASQFGSREIQTEHLLMGILRTDVPLAVRILGSTMRIESVREEIEKESPPRTNFTSSQDVPFSRECKRIMAYGAEEAEKLNQKHIGAEHLLLGLCREQDCLAVKILLKVGVKPTQIRDEATRATSSDREESVASETRISRNLTAMAQKGELEPVMGREREIERMIGILSRRTRNNVALIGESGVGKTAILHGLAQRIADGMAPGGVADRTVLMIDASALISPRGFKAGEFKVSTQANPILCVEGLFDLAATGSGWGVTEAIHLLEPRLLRGELQCIATGTPRGLRHTQERGGILARHFEVVEVLPPGPDEAIGILETAKAQLEKFHGVTISADAVEAAIVGSGRFLVERHLPERAIDLLDEASAKARLRREADPREIADLRRRIRQITREMENAIGAHKFEEARQFSTQEREARQVLEKLKSEQAPKQDTGTVAANDILEVIAERAGVSVSEVQTVLQQKKPTETAAIAQELTTAIPGEGHEWLACLAAWLASGSREDAEKLADAIRSAKAKAV